MLRSPTLNPCSPHCPMAASRIRATAVRSSGAERMFSRLNTREAHSQQPRRQRSVKSTPTSRTFTTSRVAAQREGRPVGTAIGEILPLAVALLAGPLPIIAITLILVSEDARAKGVGFVFGRIAGLALIVA